MTSLQRATSSWVSKPLPSRRAVGRLPAALRQACHAPNVSSADTSRLDRLDQGDSLGLSCTSRLMPVAFRYNIEASRSRSTNVFRPNALQGEPKAASLGALWLGKFEKLPSSKLVSIVWEALAHLNHSNLLILMLVAFQSVDRDFLN